MGASRAPRMDLGGGAEAKIKLFSEYSHVAYQIKADIVQKLSSKYFAHRTPWTQGVGLKGQTKYFFVKVVMLHIKVKGIEHRAP